MDTFATKEVWLSKALHARFATVQGMSPDKLLALSNNWHEQLQKLLLKRLVVLCSVGR